MEQLKERVGYYLARFEGAITWAGHIVESLIGLLVVAAIAITIWRLLPEFAALVAADNVTYAFMELLDRIFVVIIGLEFLTMLCRPSSDNVLETIIFLVARHMIINETTPLQDLCSTISIILLVVTRTYLARLAFRRRQVEEACEKDS